MIKELSDLFLSLADTGCSSFSCSSTCVASLLGPSGSVGGVNLCHEPAIGRWVIKVSFSSWRQTVIASCAQPYL